MSAGEGVNIGDIAPDFTLQATDGTTVRLADFRDKAEVVLFFYPKDNSPACTVEACAFRDSHEAFREAGAEVIGVSTDPISSHREFTDRHHLPFRLLSDPGGRIRKLYGVPRTLGLIPGRTTYLIDRSGVVRHAFTSQFRPAGHVIEALRVLEKMRGERAERPGLPLARGKD